MVSPIRKESWIDPSERAKDVLDFVIDDTSDATLAYRQNLAPVSEELAARPIVRFSSDRAKSRLLFITQDPSLFSESSMPYQHFKSLADVFDEIHICVLSENLPKNSETVRIEKNVWAYPVLVTQWFLLPQLIQQAAKSHLVFTDGFRPDAVIALDPYESGLAGITLAEKYSRPFQVHVFEDFTADDFLVKEKQNKQKLKLAKYVFSRTQSVRASSVHIRNAIQKRFPKVADVGLLPRHYDIQSILKFPQTNTVQSMFPQYAFVILFVGDLDHESTLYRAIDASRSVLTSPKIGLVIVGEGPVKKEFVKRTEILGITQQVVFEKRSENLISYLKSANILLCTDVTPKSDETVIKAAAAGLPILAAHTPLRDDLFTDGESAFLCNYEDTVEFSQKLVKFLNTNSLRTQFSKNAQDVVKTRLHEDPQLYKITYRDSIEVIFGGEDIVHGDVVNNKTQSVESNPAVA